MKTITAKIILVQFSRLKSIWNNKHKNNCFECFSSESGHSNDSNKILQPRHIRIQFSRHQMEYSHSSCFPSHLLSNIKHFLCDSERFLTSFSILSIEFTKKNISIGNNISNLKSYFRSSSIAWLVLLIYKYNLKEMYTNGSWWRNCFHPLHHMIEDGIEIVLAKSPEFRKLSAVQLLIKVNELRVFRRLLFDGRNTTHFRTKMLA